MHYPVRSIRQPGPPGTPRIVAVPAAVRPIEAALPAGARLLNALAALVAAHGSDSASLTLSGGALAPFAYVIPALSPDGSQAAFYSDTVRPEGATRLDTAAVTLGLRDGQPFFHCHALWTEADGTRGCGHVLPDETVVAAPIQVRGSAILGARFEVRPDAETGFSLFGPVPTGQAPPPGLAPALALRLAPNQDLVTALEDAAHQAGFGRARVQGGVASIIGARFLDARPLQGFATELLVRNGHVEPGRTRLEIAIVDLHGTIAEGTLVPGDNPVLMTFEGLLEAV